VKETVQTWTFLSEQLKRSRT